MSRPIGIKMSLQQTETIRKRMLEDNPFKGKKHTAETRNKMSENHADVKGDKNPFRILLKNNPEERKAASKRKRRSDLHGKKYGLLTVIDMIEYENGLMRGWKCICDCGKEVIVSTGNLCQGRQKSCGCYDRKLKRERSWKGHGEISGGYLYRLKRGAELRDLSFEVTIQDIWDLFLKQERKCALSGMELCFHVKCNLQTASLDRIDSNKGYIEGNLQWVHKEINKLKLNTDNQRFIELCCLVAANQK